MNNEILVNVLWKFCERISSQLTIVIVSIILARLLLPEDFGLIALAMVFVTVANILVESGIPTALIQDKDADYKDFSSVFYFNLIFSLFVYIMFYLIAPYVADFYNNDRITIVLRVLSLRVIIASVNSVQNAYASKKMLFKKYFIATFWGTCLSGALGVIMAYLGYGVWALVAQYIANAIINTFVLFITVDWRPICYYSFEKVKKYIVFGWRILFEGVSNTLTGQLSNFLIGKEYSLGDLAYYTRGQQFPTLIVSNICSSVGSVLFPAMANMQENRGNVLKLLRKSVRLTSFLVFPLLTGLAVSADSVVRLVLTDKWVDTVPYVQVFCVFNAAVVGMIPRHQALNSIGRSDVFMYEHFIARVITLVLLFYTYRISIGAIILGGFVSTLIMIFTVAYTSKKFNGYDYVDQVKDVYSTVIGCFVMGSAVFVLNYLHYDYFVKLTLQFFLGCIVYVFYSKFYAIEEYALCISIINKYCCNKKRRIF